MAVVSSHFYESLASKPEPSFRCFWAVTIFGVVAQVVIYFTLAETYGPRILYRKAQKMRKETGNETLRTEFEREDRSLKNTLRHALIRVVVMLTTQPIIIFLAAYMATTFGIIYLMLVSTFYRAISKSPVDVSDLSYFLRQVSPRSGQNITTSQSALAD